MSRDGGVDYTQLDADAEVTVSVRTKKYFTKAVEAITGKGVLKKDHAYFKITTAGEGVPTQTFKENLNCSLGLVLFNLLDEDEYAVLMEVLTSTNAPCQLQGAEEQLMPLEKRNSLREKFINIDFNQSKSININLSIDFDDIKNLVSLLELEKTRLDLPQYDVTENGTDDYEDTKAMVVSILSKINNNNVLKYAISSDSTSNAVTTEKKEGEGDIENSVDKISDETIDGKIGSAFLKQLAVLNAEAKHSIKNGCTVNIFEKLGIEGSVCEKSRDGRVLVLAPVAKDVAGEIIYREATAEDNLDDTVVINIDNTTKHEHSLRSSLKFSNIASGLMVALRTHNISMLRPDNLQSIAFPLLHLPEMLISDFKYIKEICRSDHNNAPTKSKALAIVIKYINISVATTKGGDYVNCMPWVNLIIEIGIKYLETCTSTQTIQPNALKAEIKQQTDPSSSMQTNHNDSIKGAMGELFEGGIATIASCVMIEGQIDRWINNGEFAKYISMTQQSFTSPYTLIPGILIACASAICAYFKFFVGNATSSLKTKHIKNLHLKMKKEGGALRSISNFTENKPYLSAFVSFIGSLSEPMKDFLLLSTMFQQWLQKNDYSEQKQEQYAQYFYWPLISVVFTLRFLKEFCVAFKPVQALSGHYIPFDNKKFYNYIGFEPDEISNIQTMTTTFSVKQAGDMIIKRVHGKLRELNSKNEPDTVNTQIAAITTQWFSWKRKNGYFSNYLTNNTPCFSVNKIEMCFLELSMYLKSAFNSIIEIDRLLTPFLMFCTYSYAAHEGSEFAINSLLNSLFAEKHSPTSDMMHHASTLLISFCIIRAAADAAVVVKAQFDGFREDDIRGKTSGPNGKTTPKSILFNDIIDSLRHKDPKNIIYALGFIKSCIAFEAFPGIMTLLGQTENAKELVLITRPDNAGTLIAFGAFFAPLMFKMLGTAGGKDAKAVESTLKQYRLGVGSIQDLCANSLLIQAFNGGSYNQISDTLRDDSREHETRVVFPPTSSSWEWAAGTERGGSGSDDGNQQTGAAPDYPSNALEWVEAGSEGSTETGDGGGSGRSSPYAYSD